MPNSIVLFTVTRSKKANLQIVSGNIGAFPLRLLAECRLEWLCVQNVYALLFGCLL